MTWANKIWLEGVKLSDYYNKSTKEWIDKHAELQKEFLEKWYKDYKTLGIEIDISNNDICGRMDFVAERWEYKYIFDLKSSDRVYLSHVLQLLAYKSMYSKVYSVPMDKIKIWVIHINTVEEKIIELKDESKYYAILNSLYTIYTSRESIEYK